MTYYSSSHHFAGITSLFEQAFAPVGSAPYKDYGMIFGQRIVQEAKNWRISNPEFIRNMDVFLERCGVLEAQGRFSYQ